MAQLCIIQPIEDAVAVGAGPVVDSARYSSIVVSADALAEGEIVSIYMLIGNTRLALIDDTGTVQTLTPEIYMKRLLGGPTYVFSKSLTVTPCGVYIDFCA